MIPEAILGQIVVSIVKGLQYLWTQKIMHRDLKPSNILVNTQGRVKLCDFGVSVQLIDSIARTFVGTSAYMAPERLRGEDYRMRAEVWSLGVLIFELVSGTFPYKSARDSASSVSSTVHTLMHISVRHAGSFLQTAETNITLRTRTKSFVLVLIVLIILLVRFRS